MDKFIEVFKDFKDGRVIDVATGDGAFVEFIIKYLNGFSEVIGIDTDENALSMARNRLDQPNIGFVLMNSEKLEFLDNSFDVVCISDSLHHLSQINRTLTEMKRVLKPGGLFIINEMFCDNQNEKQLTYMYLHHMRAEIDRLKGISHYETFTKNKIISMAEELELTNLDIFEHHWLCERVKALKVENMKMFFGRVVESIKGNIEYQKYRDFMNKLEKRLDDVGFEFATQLMVIGNK